MVMMAARVIAEDSIDPQEQSEFCHESEEKYSALCELISFEREMAKRRKVVLNSGTEVVTKDREWCMTLAGYTMPNPRTPFHGKEDFLHRLLPFHAIYSSASVPSRTVGADDESLRPKEFSERLKCIRIQTASHIEENKKDESRLFSTIALAVECSYLKDEYLRCQTIAAAIERSDRVRPQKYTPIGAQATGATNENDGDAGSILLEDPNGKGKYDIRDSKTLSE